MSEWRGENPPVPAHGEGGGLGGKAADPGVGLHVPEFVDLFPHPVWRANREGHWDLFNQGWLDFTGRTLEQELRKGWMEGIHPEDQDRVLQGFQKGFQSQAPFQQDFRLRHGDGSYHWVNNPVSPIRDPKGRCVGYLGSCYDLSEARTVEVRALRLGQLYEAICRINRIARLSPSSEVLFEAACRVVVEVGRLSLGWIGLRDPVSRLITPVTVHGTLQGLNAAEVKEFLTKACLSTDPDAAGGQGMVGQACREARFTLSHDFPPDERMGPWSALSEAWGICASAAFPLIVRGQVRGVLAVYAVEEEVFDSEVVDLLDRVAEDISLAIERLEQDRRWSDVEGRLRASERLFSSTLDTLSASIGILDEKGRILAVNAAWEDFRNRGNPLVHGIKPGEDYRALCFRLLSEKSLQADFAMGTLEVMDGGRPVFTGEYPGEGGTHSRWYAATVSRFAHEGLQRVVVAHRDITDQRSAGERLRQSEMLFRMITENAVDLVALLDEEGRRLYGSPSFRTILGYTAEELAAQKPLEMVQESDREPLRNTFRMVVEGSCDSAAAEYRMLRKDGTEALVEARVTAVRGLGGDATHLLLVARDISEREAAERERHRMETELVQAQKLGSIGQLAAGIAHEINTPTQFIGDNLRFIQEASSELLDILMAYPPRASAEADEDPRIRAFHERLDLADLEYLREELPKSAQQALEGVARVSKIVSAMKEFSHPESGVKALADLNRAIESTVAISRNEWKYIADMELDLDPDLPPLSCHLGAINQVVLNLVVNAAHAIGDVVGQSGQKGRITVRSRMEGNDVVIEVEDTGAGIPEAVRSQIFDPFFTTKGVGKGTGQGLAITRSVVDKHGGTIGFETELGRGTTFTIHLPRTPGAIERS